MELPSSDGHEQIGQRPCLIISNIEANTVLVVPFTTNLSAIRYLSYVKSWNWFSSHTVMNSDTTQDEKKPVNFDSWLKINFYRNVR